MEESLCELGEGMSSLRTGDRFLFVRNMAARKLE